MGSFPQGPCTHIVYASAPKCLYRKYFKAKVYTISAHGPSGFPGSHKGAMGLWGSGHLAGTLIPTPTPNAGRPYVPETCKP